MIIGLIDVNLSTYVTKHESIHNIYLSLNHLYDFYHKELKLFVYFSSRTVYLKINKEVMRRAYLLLVAVYCKFI